MTNTGPASKPPTPPPPIHRDWLAAFLGYLVPGLGQIYQGRVGKGVLFLVCIYTLFAYGVYLGQGKNVYLPDETKLPRLYLLSKGNALFRGGLELTGPAAAVGHRIQFLGQFWMGIAVWPAMIQYASKEPIGILDGYQREPSEDALNELQRNGDKSWDLGWVFTVIAGVLNIMVIYDALAGPAFVPGTEKKEENKPTTATPTTAVAASK
jgi:hypothetical protein